MMNQSPQGFDEAKEKAVAWAKKHHYYTPYKQIVHRDDVIQIFTEGFKAAKEAEYEKGYLQGLKDAKHLPTNPSNK